MKQNVWYEFKWAKRKGGGSGATKSLTSDAAPATARGILCSHIIQVLSLLSLVSNHSLKLSIILFTVLHFPLLLTVLIPCPHVNPNVNSRAGYSSDGKTSNCLSSPPNVSILLSFCWRPSTKADYMRACRND